MILIDHKKAHFDYEILEKYEAGVELFGFEVKSLKKKQGSLEGAYVIVRGGEVFLVNMSIPSYQENNTPADYDPRRNRRLLMSRKEIAKLADAEDGRGGGLTIVPILVYTKGNRIKVSVATVRGKKKYDKRESIKRRESDREISREIKGH